jgi:hypothetical protein
MNQVAENRPASRAIDLASIRDVVSPMIKVSAIPTDSADSRDDQHIHFVLL